MRRPSISSSIVLCPSHVTRRLERSGAFAHTSRGLSIGRGAGGRLAPPPKMNSPMTGKVGPLSERLISAVLWNLPSLNCLEALARSSLSLVSVAIGQT